MEGSWAGSRGKWGGMAVLAQRPRRAHRFDAIGLFALLAVSLLVAFLTPSVRGDLPTEIENRDASRTVTWTMGTAAGLAVQGVDLAGGNASLPWTAHNLSWDRPGEFAANGSLDPTLTMGAAGISLRADTANHIVDGDFVSGTPWTFEPSAHGNVSAAWDTGTATAVFRHDSPKTESSWDHLDVNAGVWAGVNGVAWTNTTKPHEGTGMLGLNFSLGPGPGAWAGVQHLAPVNWSSDRMVVWVLPSNSSLPLTFNVTAYVGATLYGTAPRALVAGWQEVSVDLTELGPVRDALISLTLRVNGQGIPSGTVYVDDLRLGNAKQFEETARVRQSVVKANATSPALGSGVVRVNWSTPTATGIVRVIGIVNVTSTSGSILRTFSAAPGSGWRPFFADVSATTALPGLYEVSVGIDVIADNTSVSSVEARIDDVSLVFPNRHNGTYLSNAVALGTASEFLGVTWAFDASGPTTLWAALRTGNDSSPGSPTWSAWQFWTAAGTYAATLPSASFLQARVDLTTTNASASPNLAAMAVATRHRSMQSGSVASGVFTIPAAELATFRNWRILEARSRTPAGTSISFAIGDGTYWKPVGSDGNITDTNSTMIRWSATLATTNGLVTPTLERVDLVYEYLGLPARVELRWPGWPSPIVVPSGGVVRFTAVALDAGSHVISKEPNRFDWNTNDSHGQVGIDGSYRAGEAGDHIVNVTFVGTTLSATVHVRVLAAGTWIDAMIGYAPYWLAVLTLGAVGYTGYRFGIRRTSAIDDVFLISKDGRLMMHNTRRMRADRDADILSGMLTAILSFLKDADPEENGELRRFEVGGKTTLLERGPHAYLVAVYSGKVPRRAGKNLRRFMTSLETNFGDAFARWSGDPEDLQDLKAFTGRFVSPFRFRPPRRMNGRAS